MKLVGRELEFDEITHTYYVDRQVVPSVTQLLNRKFGGRFDNIPKDILRTASERGIQIHKAIECYCGGFDDGSAEVRDYKFLERMHHFKAVENEIPVILDLGGKTYAGRLDMIISINDGFAVADIKTTSSLDKEYLGHQLNLYRIGVEQCYDYKISELYGIHLKDGKRKLVKIPIKEEEWLLKSLGLTGTELQ